MHKFQRFQKAINPEICPLGTFTLPAPFFPGVLLRASLPHIPGGWPPPSKGDYNSSSWLACSYSNPCFSQLSFKPGSSWAQQECGWSGPQGWAAASRIKEELGFIISLYVLWGPHLCKSWRFARMPDKTPEWVVLRAKTYFSKGCRAKAAGKGLHRHNAE